MICVKSNFTLILEKWDRLGRFSSRILVYVMQFVNYCMVNAM